MESRGNEDLFTWTGEHIGVNRYGSTLHFGINRTTDAWRLAHFLKYDENGFHSKFHNYGMIWTPGKHCSVFRYLQMIHKCFLDEFIFLLDGEVIGILAPPEGGFWELGKFNGTKGWSDNKMSPFDQHVSKKFKGPYNNPPIILIV